MMRSRLASFALVVLVAACGEITTDASAGDDPKITAISPERGPAIGGITVTLTGTGLGGANPVVLVDGVLATEATAAGDTSLSFMLPAGEEGATVDITVATERGFGTAPQSFKFNLRPVVLSIDPPFGRFAGGSTVTITGRGFEQFDAGVPTVLIGGSPATNVQIVDDRTVTAVSAAAQPTTPAFAPTDIEVTNANGTAVVKDAFTLSKQGLLATSSSNRSVLWIDPVTKTTITIASNMSTRLGGCALGPNGKLYGKGSDPTNGEKVLVTFDPIARTVEYLGTFKNGPTQVPISSMAFVGNNLYGLSMSGNGGTNQLFQVNPMTAALTPVTAANPAVFVRHSGIGAKDGTSVWHAARTTTPLNSVNITTGAITPGATLNGAPSSRELRGFVTLGTTLYAIDDTSQTPLYSVNTATGELTSILSAPLRLSSLCQTPPSF